jgi:signal transduction histidine kinase/CheY-like chemotaxis protein
VLGHFRRTLDTGAAHAAPTFSELRKDTPDVESYDWKIERIVLPDGGFGVVCYFYDLTERQQAAEALRLRAAQFETLVGDAPLGIYLVDAQLRICQVNPLALQVFDNIEDLIGHDLAGVMQTLLGPKRADDIVQQFRRTLSTGQPFEAAELIGLNADRGTFAYYEWQIHRIPLPDGSDGAVCYMRDVSARVEAQARIRDSEMRYRAIVTASADVVYRMSPDWREMRQLHGRNFIADTHEPTAQWLHEYIHPKDQPRVLAAIDAAIAAKGLFELEHQVLRVDGEMGWTQSRAVPLLDADGAIVEWFGTASDVTDRKRIEADLITALAAAEAANRAKSEFLSRMSHELRSPLNAVLGFAQLLQCGAPPPTAQQEEGLDEILKAGWYLLGLIDEVLDLSLIESGRLSIEFEMVPLAEVLDECQALVEGQAAQRGIRLSRSGLDEASVVIADRTRLKQVFINILSNAIKYNREGGTVQVHGEAVRQDRMCIRIEDSGSGLTREQLGCIFEPFERLGQERGAIEGTGIGLALSKRLVEQMGGRIGVQSVVGHGSVFWVELDAPGVQVSVSAGARESPPGTDFSLQHAAATPVPAAAGRRPCTVLSVEDDRANQLLVQRLLARRTDVRLLLAGNGTQGVQLARAMQPDVVLMDIHLPGLSGLEAMEHLAADPATAHIPIIAVSAQAMPHDIDKGLQAGFFCYLIKPIKIDALTAALDAALTGVDPPHALARAIAPQPAVTTSSARSARSADKTRKDHTP